MPPQIGVQTVTGQYVDNTDPKNPVVLVQPTPQLPYKVWSGWISQSGTNAPVLVPAPGMNTLGTISSTYEQPGQYHITSNGLFTTGKTQFFLGPQINAGNLRLSKQSPNWAFLLTTDFNEGGIDGLIINIPVALEIRVYL